ncbi:MAG TPA: AtzE family amidohydrolase [Geminicoccus sp.]|jgi:aspartyl-tRNA(Asn)/glutamyl-tRNA(Gln) amidotransferase subunit A|uniref:AtzE family amidohydrolase n=1 Tax=Geminicoccus sp. TaxID=2024832 RepID=UPI002E2F2A0C|nr:AtzE family amidohydrolase [Geminicoccus sp.]HEX2526703.1 AtzE family amidohydrolase [Geminicoccus sp.]
MTDLCSLPGHALADLVARRQASVREIVDAHLGRIAAHDRQLGAFTDLVAERARARAAKLDGERKPLPLKGVPFAVKNLFDIEGLPTRAGSKINRQRRPAARDATAIRRLEAAGAVLLGGLNMGEYAYDFTGRNCHDGPSLNPRDPTRMSGGSSGGSGTAVAAGFVPVALGSDTNGSIRVPASFCGLFGLKPTYGRLSRGGSFPFVASLDHVGPLARSVRDLAAIHDAWMGVDPDDPVVPPTMAIPLLPTLDQSIGGLQMAVLDGWFARSAQPEALAAVHHVAEALGVTHRVRLDGAEAVRAAAYLITMAEGAALHKQRLRTRAADFDPEVRDRLLAGTMLPASWVVTAHKLRRRVLEQARRLFGNLDILLAPATPCTAPAADARMIVLDGVELPLRANIGLFTQPISAIGLPVVAVPVTTVAPMPIGVQIIAAPGREDLALRVARHLEKSGAVASGVANGYGTP